jgi:hypothetical protein
MKYGRDTISWIVMLMATSSLLSMICLFQIDKIVHGNLYSYGLSFSYDWAAPYWTLVRTAFAMGWLNITIAFAVQLYNVRFRRKEVEQLVTAFEEEVSKSKKPIEEKAKEQKDEEPKRPETTKEAPAAAQPKPETQEKKEEQQPPPKDQPDQQTEPQQPKDTPEQKPEPPEIDLNETPILAGL